MQSHTKILVSGARGLVGSAISRALRAQGFDNLLEPARAELDLTEQAAVRDYLGRERPEVVFVAAAKVGGIHANNAQPAEFIHDNLALQTNLIHEAWRHGTRKLVFLGSSCIYPRDAAQPMREEALLGGPLEPTNAWYAVAKIAGIKMCQAYRRQYGFDAICLMPTNLYGPGDNFSLETSHVLPALLRKAHEARLAGSPELVVWGSGTPRREFLYVDDLAEAAVHLARHYSDEQIVNVGVGEDISIAELVALVADVVGYTGRIVYDRSKPDGTPRKLLDVARLHALGWRARTPLRDGVARTYAWYLEEIAAGHALRGAR